MHTISTLLVLLLASTSLALTGDQHPIVWSEVPTTPAAALIADEEDVGTCICDLSFDACDANCRCDPDCSTVTVTSVFSGSEDEGPREVRVFKCVDPELIEVNARGGLHTSIVDNLLCVEEDNNESQGDFFTDPGNDGLTEAEFADKRQAREFTFQPVLASEGDTSASYRVDDLLRGATGGNFDPLNEAGVFPLASSGFTSECVTTSGTSPRFLRDTTEMGSDGTCVVSVTDLSTECATAFASPDVGSGGSLFVGGARTMTYSNAAALDWVRVTIASLTQRDAAGADTAQAVPATPPTPSFAAGTCSNALLEVEYHFNYSTDGRIQEAEAHLIVGDVTSTRVRQRHTAVFVPEGRPKAGNPGYVDGKPVLVGRVVSNSGKQAVSQFVDGFEVLPHEPGTGECVLPSSAVGATERYQVQFGNEALYGCSLSLTSAQLSQYCGTSPSTTFWTEAFNVSDLVIGIFGNSDLTNVNDWLALDTTTSSPVFTCDSITNVLNLEFVTADVGALLNPQRKILDARVQYSSSGAWTFPAGVSLTTPRKFFVYVSVTFIHVPPDGLVEKVPPAPPLFPRMPRDVLYPLYVEDESSAPRAGASLAMLALLGSLLLAALN